MEVFFRLVRNIKPLGKYMVRVLSAEQIKRRLRFLGHSYSMGWIKEREVEILLNELKRRNIPLDNSILWSEEILKMSKANSENSVSQSYPEEGRNKEKYPYFISLAKERKSIRQWLKKPVPDTLVEELVQAGIEAPSSCNRQSWRFLFVKNQNEIDFISRMRRMKFIADAPLLIIVLIDGSFYGRRERGYTPFLDAGAAVENILLAAQAHGLGACWVNMGRCEISYWDIRKIIKRFKIPKRMILSSLIAIGYPASNISKPKRNRPDYYIYRENRRAHR